MEKTKTDQILDNQITIMGVLSMILAFTPNNKHDAVEKYVKWLNDRIEETIKFLEEK